jgi:type II secretory pathway component PulC
MPRAGAVIAIAARIGLACAAIAPAVAAPDFQGHLTGIVIAATLREAIFIEEGTTRRLHPGDTIEGWTLASIEPDAVTLTADGVTTRLSPARSPSSSIAQPPPPSVVRTHQVSDALRRQQRDQAAAEAAMTAATAKLEAEKAAHRGNRTP